ncbi:MAG: HEAT repeat domain-containing protein [Planctomycetota bacterium]
MTDPQSPNDAPFPDAVGEAPGAAEASDLVGRFLKALKGYRLYLPNNQVLVGFIDSFREGLAVFLERYGDLCLHVSQFRITWDGATVYDNTVKEESLAFRFFIHGVREITFHEGVPEEEVVDFLRIIHRAFDAKTTVDDLLTLLWEREFRSVTFIVLEDFFEEGDQAEFDDFLARSQVSADNLSATPQIATRPVLEKANAAGDDDAPGPLPSVELTDDERERLALWVEEEKKRDLPRSLMSIVLEILADVPDPADSIEILGVLNRLLDTLFEEDRIHEAVNVYRELRRLGREGGEAFSSAVEQSLARLDASRLVRAVVACIGKNRIEEPTDLVEFLADRGAAAVPVLLDLLPDPELSDAAVLVLRELADDHLPAVLAGLSDPRPACIVPILRLVGERGDIRSLNRLRKVLASEDVILRREAVRAIAALRSPASVSILTEILADPAPEVRVAAIRALAGLPPDRTRDPLLAFSRRRDFGRRTYLEKKEVFLALGRLRDPGIETWLIGVLKKRSFFRRDERDELRACAVAALAVMGTDAAIRAVRARANDKSPKVRQAVAQAVRE